MPYAKRDGLSLYCEQRGRHAPQLLLALKPDIQIGITVAAGHFHQLEVHEQVTPRMEKFIQMVGEAST
jgi:hypothetical protein